MIDPLAPFALAERVAAAARNLGIETALIGASAFAVHNYIRATQDVDLATAVDPRSELRELERALLEQGLRAKLRMPDEEDVLGGMLIVWEHEDDAGEPLDHVEVVNFYNPYRSLPNPGANAIKNAAALDDQSPLRCVRLPDLIALKLYAGSRQDLADIVQLLARNTDANLDEIRLVAEPYDGRGELETLILEAAQQMHR